MERIRPTVKEITLEDTTTRNIRVYLKRPILNEIIARVEGTGKVVLWSGNDYDTHKDDTEAQFRTQLLSILNA